MNYIYDIFLNLKKTLYDFYDWNKEDELSHIKKIPSFKISKKDLLNIKNNQIKINENILNKIYNKSEEFKKNNIKKIKYLALFSDGNNVIGITFNKNGISNKKSVLAIDEEEDIIDTIKYQKETNINYKIIKKEKNNNFKTRFEIENEKFIMKELTNISKKNNSKKLSYICLECFGKEEKDINKATKKIKKEIIKGNDNFYKIFNIFKITTQK